MTNGQGDAILDVVDQCNCIIAAVREGEALERRRFQEKKDCQIKAVAQDARKSYREALAHLGRLYETAGAKGVGEIALRAIIERLPEITQDELAELARR